MRTGSARASATAIVTGDRIGTRLVLLAAFTRGQVALVRTSQLAPSREYPRRCLHYHRGLGRRVARGLPPRRAGASATEASILRRGAGWASTCATPIGRWTSPPRRWPRSPSH